MKFARIFCKDKEFIQLVEHKNKYDLVLLEMNKKICEHPDSDDKIKLFITDDIIISCVII